MNYRGKVLSTKANPILHFSDQNMHIIMSIISFAMHFTEFICYLFGIFRFREKIRDIHRDVSRAYKNGFLHFCYISISVAQSFPH